jgi:hypothetical protein
MEFRLQAVLEPERGRPSPGIGGHHQDLMGDV